MNKTLGIIGLGSMGSMLLSRFSQDQNLQGWQIVCTNRSPGKVAHWNQLFPQATFAVTNLETARRSQVLFLCIKPVDFPSVLQEISAVDLSEKTIVSLNATVPLDLIGKQTGCGRVAKIVPSITAEVGESPTLVAFSDRFTPQDKEPILALLGALGNPLEVGENQVGFGSELMSCMPGLLSSLLSEMQKTALGYGIFDQETVRRLLVQTLYGTGKLLLEKKMTFDQVNDRVATKGGITREGIHVIEDMFPPVSQRIFQVTMEKRREIAQKTAEAFPKSP